jgi:hypothetical protein
MKNTESIYKKEISRMELIGAKYIQTYKATSIVHSNKEVIDEHTFVSSFNEIDLRKLFALKVFSRN